MSRSAAQSFANGLEQHRAGKLEAAEAFYRQALAQDPRHADSLNLLSVIAFQTGSLDQAEALSRQAIAIAPNAGPYHSSLGNALKNQGRLAEAETSYRKAMALKPDFPEAYNNLGLALHQQGRLEEAVALYRQALALEPDYPEACNNLGLGLQEEGHLAEAASFYRRAIALRPQYQLAHSNLGNALRDEGRFTEAIAMHEKALSLGPDRSLSCYGLSGCRKFTAADQKLIAQMTAMLDDSGLPPAKRAMLNFALGKIFDDLAQYETAIRHFDEANRLERQTNHFSATDFSALVDWLIAAFPKETPASPAASDSQRPVLIVGMPRSGTTLVEQILASHPDVAAGGELNFWLQRSEGIRKRQVRQLDIAAEQATVRDYLAVLVDIDPSARRVTDKMPYNFLLLGLVHRLFPQARIIHCRRNAADTALSVYFTRFNRLHEFAYDRSDIVAYIRSYQRLMAHWRVALPSEQFLEIDYESLVADQETVSRKMLAFCGLDWNEACRDFYRTDRPIVTSSAWQARQPIQAGSVERWRHYQPWLGELRTLLPAG